MASFLSGLKVGDKIDFYDEAQWKVAIIKGIKKSTGQYQFHLSFDRYYEMESHIDSWFERQDCNQWISCSTEIIQPLNTHTPYHGESSHNLESCHNLEYNFCKKCGRKCCLSCFVIRDYGDSSDSKNTTYCKECVQICHKQKKCSYIHGNKCSRCQKENVCIKCAYIHIYNKLNGELISRQCYECYPLIQNQVIFIITKSMFKIQTDINILKLVTNYVFNATLRCKYQNCSEQTSVPIWNNKLKHNYTNASQSLLYKGIVCSDIDPNCVFICNKHSWLHVKETNMYCHQGGYGYTSTVDTSSTNQTKLKCGTIGNYHYPENTAKNCYHCKGQICIACDKIIECAECGKVCHHSKCDYQDYIVLCGNNYYTQSVECKNCNSTKAYQNELDVTKIICKSMVITTSIYAELNIEGNRNIFELVLNYYYIGDLTLQFLVQPLTYNTLKNGLWCIDDESGYCGKMTKLKMCKYGKHGHAKIFFKMHIPFTGKILDKMIRSQQLRSLKRCVVDKTEHTFIKYVDDDDKKLIECKNKETGEVSNINISCLEQYYSKVTDFIDKKKENETLILSVLNGPKYCSQLDQLVLVQCILDAKIERETDYGENMINID